MGDPRWPAWDSISSRPPFFLCAEGRLRALRRSLGRSRPLHCLRPLRRLWCPRLLPSKSVLHLPCAHRGLCPQVVCIPSNAFVPFAVLVPPFPFPSVVFVPLSCLSPRWIRVLHGLRPLLLHSSPLSCLPPSLPLSSSSFSSPSLPSSSVSPCVVVTAMPRVSCPVCFAY